MPVQLSVVGAVTSHQESLGFDPADWLGALALQLSPTVQRYDVMLAGLRLIGLDVSIGSTLCGVMDATKSVPGPFTCWHLG